MRLIFLVLIAFVFSIDGISQNLYFPPINTGVWNTTSLTQLGWCSNQLPPLYDFLEQSNSKAFIELKDGEIVIEKYFGTSTQDNLWY
jgi:hypothetical protein